MEQTSTLISSAPKVFNLLNGIVNVYKPAGRSSLSVRNAIRFCLCKDLNEMNVRPSRERIAIESGGPEKYFIRRMEDLSDHVLAVGPRYEMTDIKCSIASRLGPNTSGVLLVGINNGAKLINKLQDSRQIRVYHVHGTLGRATEDHFSTSRVTVRSSYGHVNQSRIDNLLSSIQASHQRKMFELCGVDISSQAAFELASKGPIRPAEGSIPVLYGIKCITFDRPKFTLEVHAINENENYLATLIHEIGIELKSTAHCTGIQCIRFGHFSIEKSLLRRHWNLQGVLSNISISNQLLKHYPEMLNQHSVELSGDKLEI